MFGLFSKATKKETPKVRSLGADEYLYPNDEQRRHLENAMRTYFSADLNLFPFSTRRRRNRFSWIWWRNSLLRLLLLHALTNDEKPVRFYEFYVKEVIEKRFPETDDVPRERFQRYRSHYIHLLYIMTSIKRIFFVFSLIVILMYAGYFSYKLSLVATIFIEILLLFTNGAAWYFYRMYIKSESGAISADIHTRTTDLRDIFSRAASLHLEEETKPEYKDNGEKWGERGRYLINVMMFISKRLEHLEKYIQVEMWRIRRQRMWVDLFGMAMIHLILATFGYFVFLVDHGSAGKEGTLLLFGLDLYTLFETRTAVPVYFGLTDYSAKVALMASAVFLAFISYLSFSTPIFWTMTFLNYERWIKFSNLKLDDAIGGQIATLSALVVMNRNLFRQQNTPGSGRVVTNLANDQEIERQPSIDSAADASSQ